MSKKRERSPSLKELEDEMKQLRGHISKKLKQGGRRKDVSSESCDENSDGEASIGSEEVPLEIRAEDENSSSTGNKENIAANDQGTSSELEETKTATEVEFVELDEETLQILSEDDESDKDKGLALHPRLASNWQKILSEGLKKDKKMALLDKYPRLGKGPFVTPKLNFEIEASINETSKKRDRFFTADLELCGAGLVALGSDISMIFNSTVEEINTKELLTRLVDSGRLMCELHSQLIKARKAFLYPCVDKKARPILEKTHHGEFLFGPDLSQKIKTVKAVEKLGLSIKQFSSEKKPTFQASSTLNWRGPPVRNRGQAGRRNFGSQRGQGQLGTLGRQQITDDPFVIQCLKGYKIEFNEKPVQNRVPRQGCLNRKDEPLIGDIVTKLLELGAISKVKKLKEQFVSTYFLVAKPNGKMRFILNLKGLNKFIPTQHFKMEDFRTAIKLVSRGCFMGSLDLKDAYFLIPLHRSSQKYICFDWNNNRYQWNCIPFGLNVAPWLFTKIMKPLINNLRKNGLISVVYLDDWLCFGNNYEDCLRNLVVTRKMLESLGFIINEHKSNLIPSRTCQFLGFILNSSNMTIELPETKKFQIVSLLREMKNRKICTIREFARLVGCIIAACPAIQYGWLYSKKLERAKYLWLLRNNLEYSSSMIIPLSLSTDLDWWEDKVLTSHNKIRRYEFELEIFSDASNSGWGVACEGEIIFNTWNVVQLKEHINYLELVAAFYGLRIFARNKHNCEILLRIDNTTAVSYVNRMGGVQYPKLNQISREIWQFCEKRDIWIFASYIASKENEEADAASRTNHIDIEWELADWAFRKVCKEFGEIDIDLFASRENKKCNRYISWKLDSGAYCVDAFTVSWKEFKFYAFPPFSLLLRTLQKIKSEQAQGIVIAPFWPSQTWYPLWNDMLVNSTSIGIKNEIDGRTIIRQAYLRQGFGRETIEVLIQSISDTTLKQYSRFLVEWAKYCQNINTNIYNPKIESVADFLCKKHASGASFSTINTCRAALSLILGEKVGKNAVISRLLKGMYNVKPSKPKYDKIYDLDPVILELEKLYPLEELSLPDLTNKLIVLLALITAHRKQTISLIKISNIVRTNSGYEIKIPQRVKNSGIGVGQPLLVLPEFSERPQLCVVKTINEYLKVTKELRGDCDSLFLTTTKPFRKASKDTLSRWLRSFLIGCGVDREFTPHSLRHAATSAALKRGVSISIIKRLAGWSEKSTVFNRFYNRPIVKDKNEFARAVVLRNDISISNN
ncbi:uncharacterized protein [Prorops nasuta]|uniref:uncharacterized protein n=1 Tax=Prorops nasuta TaxID=863751 RepID=UPI0034CDAA21